MKIYIVAGERNRKPGAVKDNGGLWANVGETDRTAAIRLLDEDYRRKAAGGKWDIIAEYEVGDEITDRQIHNFLKFHSEVHFDYSSNNTEEFLFETDDGTGSRAKEIVSEYLKDHYGPMVIESKRELQAQIEVVQAEKAKLETSIAEYLNTDEGKLKTQYLSLCESLHADLELAKRNAELRADQKIEAEREEFAKHQEYLQQYFSAQQKHFEVEHNSLKEEVNKAQKAIQTEMDILSYNKELAEKQRKFNEQTLLEVERKKAALESRDTKLNWTLVAIACTLTFCGSNFIRGGQKARLERELVMKNNEAFQLVTKLQEAETKLGESQEKIKTLEASNASKDQQALEKANMLGHCESALDSAQIPNLDKPKQQASKPAQPKAKAIEQPKVVLELKEKNQEVVMVRTPAPPKVELPKVEPPKPEPPKVEAPAPPVVKAESQSLMVCKGSCRNNLKRCYREVLERGRAEWNGPRFSARNCEGQLSVCEELCEKIDDAHTQ